MMGDVEQAFLFADLAGFTQLTEAHGDHQAADLVERYADDLGSLASEYGADVVKTIGDAVMMRVPDACDAIAIGVRVVDEVGAQHGIPAVRVGIDYGPAAERGGDYIGRTVNTAARVTELAGAGEVLITDAVRSAAGNVEGSEVKDHGCHKLKGVTEDVVIYKAMVADTNSDEDLPIDPVCKMAVDPAHCVGSVEHKGVEYHFCSQGCKERFSRSPDSFV